MKKQIIIAALALGAFVFGTNNAQAQVTTAVNIELEGFISIDANESNATGGIINFNYSSPEDYESDQTVSQNNALVVSATEGFDIKVKSNDANFSLVNGNGNIPIDALKIKAVNGGSLNGNHNEITLSQDDQTIVDNSPKGMDLKLNLEYFIPQNKAQNFLGKTAGTYTGTVTYTVTAD